jgi:hypothetical protein
VAVDATFEFIGSSGTLNKAASAMDLGDQGPRDVRVGDTYLSMTDGAGTYLNVIRTSDYKSHMLVLDTVANSNP